MSGLRRPRDGTSKAIWQHRLAAYGGLGCCCLCGTSPGESIPLHCSGGGGDGVGGVVGGGGGGAGVGIAAPARSYVDGLLWLLLLVALSSAKHMGGVGAACMRDVMVLVVVVLLVMLVCGLAGRSAAGARGSGLPVGWAAGGGG